MGDDDDGAAFGVDGLEELGDLFFGLGIELAGGLVGEDDVRVVDQGTGDGDALFLAAGHLADLTLGESCDAGLFERFHNTLMSILLILGEVERDHDVVIGGPVRDEGEVLENDADLVVADLSKSGITETGHVRAGDKDRA